MPSILSYSTHKKSILKILILQVTDSFGKNIFQRNITQTKIYTCQKLKEVPGTTQNLGEAENLTHYQMTKF